MNVPTLTARAWTFKALTPIWTGDVDRKGARLITTGILGSVRWWFEVVVRGLNGSACDPTHHRDNKSEPCPAAHVKHASDPGHHCVVCELFGCTGWARKFRLQVVDGKGKVLDGAIKKESTVALHFIPLRPVAAEEWALLDLTLRLIAEYGALGGRTVLKPSDEKGRQDATHHQDYGLIKIEQRPPVTAFAELEIKRYVKRLSWRKVKHDGFEWASLENSWFVDRRRLTREDAGKSSFNMVVGRNENKACRDCNAVHDPPMKCPNTHKHPRRYSERLAANGEAERWLAGKQQESKKVFSFKSPPRTFGFVLPGILDFQQMRERLKSAWPDLKDDEVVEGPAILARLLGPESGAAS